MPDHITEDAITEAVGDIVRSMDMSKEVGMGMKGRRVQVLHIGPHL